MTHTEGFERLVADWLHDRADWTAPSYLDEVLTQTRRIRQRPSWSGLDRWLPGAWAPPQIARPRIGRLVVILALLLALAAAAVLVGSRPKLPPPFGLAGNGVILFGAGDGDLYALDVVTGDLAPVVTGVPEDETPDFSHDGSRFVFARKGESVGRWLLMVANADGSNARPLTGPVDPTWNAWSPDDMQVAVVDSATAPPTLTLYRLDGRASLTLNIDGRVATNATFLPDGSEIVFLGSKAGSSGVYAVATTGLFAPREIVPPVGSTGITNPILSPDGATLAYTHWEVDHSVIHLEDLATGSDRPLQLDAESDGENTAAWSPDGTQLLFHRHHGGSYQLAVASPTGGSVTLLGPTVPEGTGDADVVFSPDGRMVIARYEGDGSLWLLDVAGGPGRPLDIEASALVAWQRVAR